MHADDLEHCLYYQQHADCAHQQLALYSVALRGNRLAPPARRSRTFYTAVIYNHGLSIANTGTTVGALLQSAETFVAANPQSPLKSSVGKFFSRSVPAAVLAFSLLPAVGCGNNYRPVITAINPVGPAGQPTKYAIAISDPNLGAANGTLPGLMTFVDYSGDTVAVTVGTGIKPYYLILNSGGSAAYTLNGDGTVNTVAIATTVITSTVSQTTLLANPAPNAASIFPQGTYTYITQPGRNNVAELTGAPLTLQQELSAVGPSPIYIAGVAAAPRIYVLSPNAVAGAAGTATPIEVATNTPESALPVGINPVYGVMTADARRAFILNNGSNSVSVIDAQNNQLDTGVVGGTIQDPNAVAPIWADFAPTLSEVAVVNAGDGVSNGSVSIFSIPLCSAIAQPTNPLCNINNPIDAAGFGTLVANVPVGKNPVMIGVLQDGTQAYVINKGDSTVSVINLVTNRVSATIPVPATASPTFIAVTTGTPTGKVYVTSATSSTMTVIRTDTDAVDTTIPLQGFGVQVRVTAP